MQQNHLTGCSFSTETDIKNKERGTFREKKNVVVNVEIRAVKWFDSREVIIFSTLASAQPVSNIERWNRKLEKGVCRMTSWQC